MSPELDSPLPSFTDLLFFGSRGSAVSGSQSRNDTGTLALQFTGQADSVVVVPSQYQPQTITTQLTLRYSAVHVARHMQPHDLLNSLVALFC